jgi:argininosuccinate lyase
VRLKTGRIVGALVSLLTTMKGLPSSYQRDLQEDKEPVFAAHDQSLSMLRVATGAIAATKFNEARLRAAAAEPALMATEAADYLVARGVPFREAHEIVGRVIRQAEEAGKSLGELPLSQLKTFSPAFGADLAAALTLEASLARRRVAGGTASETVRAALDDLQSRLRCTEDER